MTGNPDRTAEKDGETRRPPGGWSQENLAFAVGELSREFPSAGAGRAEPAVREAAIRVLPQEGRVRLLQLARRFMRTG